MAERKAPAKELKDVLNILLPAENTYRVVVSKDEQLKLLEGLNENISNESFYFVFNLLTCELEHVNGIEKWLGYSDKEFTVNRYLNSIHAGQSVLFNIIALNMYKTLCSGSFKLQFYKQKYISFLALKHYNGEYIAFKKTTSVFQYDNTNKLLAQLNEFTKIDIYEGEPLKTRITETNGFQKDDFERMVFAMVLKEFMGKKYFSYKEFEILKHYANNETVNSKQLAALLNVEETTINTFNKRILQKGRKTFTHTFATAKDIALYLKKEKIL